MTYKELINALKTAEKTEDIDDIKEEIAHFLPIVKITWDYDQKNSAHQYDLWFHSIHVLLGLPRDIDDDMLYLAALLHDVGKPDCQVRGKREDDPDMHYYGHPKHSMELVRDKVIPHLIETGVELTSDDKERLLYYVEHHDDRITLLSTELRTHLEIPVSFQEFRNLMYLEMADALAHVQIPVIEKRLETCRAWAGEYGEDTYHQMAAMMFDMM